jgi:hypothetical protein
MDIIKIKSRRRTEFSEGEMVYLDKDGFAVRVRPCRIAEIEIECGKCGGVLSVRPVGKRLIVSHAKKRGGCRDER